MPTLQHQPTVFPENVLESPPHGESQRLWWVAHTRSRQEKAFARDLTKMETPFYLPLVKRLEFSRGRRRVVQCPLFAGYVFLFCSESERLRCLKTNRLCQTLSVCDSQRLVGDLKSVQRLIASNAPLTVESRLKEGDRVRVRCGSLLGIEGHVIRRHNGGPRLLVAVRMLQQGVSIDIEDYMLEPI